MAFGLSKNDSKSDMNNADAVVAFIDKRRKGHGVDYFLGSKEQVRNKLFCRRFLTNIWRSNTNQMLPL